MQGQSTPVSFARAAVVMVMAIMLYDVMGAIVKHLSQQYPVPQIAVFRNIFGLVPTVIILLCSQAWAQAGRPLMIRQWRLAIARGGLGVSAQLGFYFSLLHLELATATSLLFAGPMFVTALSVPVLGHRVGLWRWLAVLAGFAGVLMVMRPGADSFTWYAILPLCAAFGYACVSVSSQLFDKEVPTGLINLYTNIGALTGAPIN